MVTGAAGFMGSFLCEELLSRGYSVVGVDNLFRGNLDNLKNLPHPENFTFIKMDLSRADNIAELHDLMLSNNITMLFHLAAINGTQYFYDHSYFLLDQNIRITQNLLVAAENTSIDYIIYTSSSEAYGEPLHLPTLESDPILLNAQANRDSYAASKAVGDFYIRLFCQNHPIKCLILRVFNLYGERMINTRYGQVIPEFIKRLLDNVPFTIIGDGNQTRSFCYIEDAICAICELVKRETVGLINVGNDQEIKIVDLAKRIHLLEKKTFEPIFTPPRPNDHQRRWPDITLLKSLLPDLHFTPLDEGLNKVIHYYKKTLSRGEG